MSSRAVYQVTDNVHDTIEMTALERNVASGPLFGRLHFVYQDSTVFFTWPTARTQRYEHSLGTMHLAGRMLFSALANARSDVIQEAATHYGRAVRDLIDSDFVSSLPDTTTIPLHEALQEISSFICRLDARDLDQDLLSTVDELSFLVPSRVPGSERTLLALLAQGVRLAGMLHDVGHPPMSHVCEFALRDIYEEVSDGPLSSASAAGEIRHGIDGILRGKSLQETALHEEIGNNLAALVLVRAIHDLAPTGDTRGFVLTAGLVSLGILNDWSDLAELHSIISSTVDADRLDYVQRDSMAANLGADALQYQKLSDTLRLMRTPDGKFAFAYSMEIAPTIEEFLTKRFMIYKEVIFHPSVVRSEELLKGSLSQLTRNYLLNGDHQGAQRLELLSDDISGLWQPLSCDLSDEPCATLTYSQWNDYWLRTMLRNELIIRVQHGRDDNLLTLRLMELFYPRGRYVPIMEDLGDNARFRKVLSSLMQGKEGDLAAKLVPGLKKNAVPQDIVRYWHRLGESVPSFDSFLRRSIGEILRSHGYDFRDIIVVTSRVRSGVGPVNLYRKRDEALVPLDDVSPIRTVLEHYAEGMPLFYGYVLFDDRSALKGAAFLRGDAFVDELAHAVSQILQRD